MTASRIRIAAATFSLAGCFAVLPIGIAYADCTTAGDFGAGAGCSPPSSGSGKADSWPPTSVDWPPQLDSDTGSDSSGSGKQTPIVMPNGQKLRDCTFGYVAEVTEAMQSMGYVMPDDSFRRA